MGRKKKEEIKAPKKTTKTKKKVTKKNNKVKRYKRNSKFKLKLSRDMLPFLSDRQFERVCTSNEEAIEFIRTNKRLTKRQKDMIYNELIKANYYMVLSITKDLYTTFQFMISYEDLLDACNFGLGKALTAYNPEKGKTKFSSFAYACILNEGRYACRTADRFYNREESLEDELSWDSKGNKKTYEDIFEAPKVEITHKFDKTPLHKFCINRLSFSEKYILYNYNELKPNTYLTQKQMALLLEYPKSYLTSKHSQAKNKIKNDYCGPINSAES